MESRVAKISGIFIFGSPILGGIIAGFLCFSVSWWAFAIGITGLGLDLVGAILIVVTEIDWFDQFWRDEERFQEAKRLDDARNRLYDGEEQPFESGEPEFQRLIDVIREHQSITITPHQLKPPKPGGLGGSNHIRIFEENGDSNPDRVHIHNTLFNNWIDKRITDLHAEVRDSIRFVGLLSLLIGFGLQAVIISLTPLHIIGRGAG
ncbi:MAG: hypothetical protein U5J98_07040 [Halobacteriales archaeon]|nr:hypothetical protein [Halobacteriales archaeon]